MRRRRTACRRWRSPISPTRSASSSSTRRRARRGIKPIAGCDVWITHDTERDAPFRAILLAADRAGYLKLCDWLSRAYRTNQHRGRAELRREWFAEGTDGLIALSGARHGDVGAALAQGNAAAAHQGRARMGRMVSAALLPRSAARGPPRRRRAGHGDRRARRASTTLPVVATHPVQFLHARRISGRTKRACASPRATCCPTRAGRGASPPSSTSRRRRRWRRASPTCRRRSPTVVAIAQRCNLTIPLGKNYLPEFPTPAGVTIDEHLRMEAVAGLERRLAQLYPDAGDARREARPSTTSASTSKRARSCRWDSRATS